MSPGHPLRTLEAILSAKAAEICLGRAVARERGAEGGRAAKALPTQTSRTARVPSQLCRQT